MRVVCARGARTEPTDEMPERGERGSGECYPPPPPMQRELEEQRNGREHREDVKNDEEQRG